MQLPERGASDVCVKRYRLEESSSKLLEAEVLLAEGVSVGEVARRLDSQSVLAVLADLMVRRGVPDHIRSESGSPRSAPRPRLLNRAHPGRTAKTRASTASSGTSCQMCFGSFAEGSAPARVLLAECRGDHC